MPIGPQEPLHGEPSWAKDARDRWAAAAQISSGPVLRRVDKAGHVGSSGLGAQSIFETVAAYGVRITPHDLRRTFAKLAHKGRAPLEQIQITLVHASIQITERYLGLSQNLHDAPCDRLGLVGWEGWGGARRVLPGVPSRNGKNRTLRRMAVSGGVGLKYTLAWRQGRRAEASE